MNTPSQERGLGSGRPFDPRANGFRMSSFVLKTARSVKLSAFWTPFHGQLEGDVWRPTGEARESVARNDAKKTVVNMISSRSASGLCSSKMQMQACFYTLTSRDALFYMPRTGNKMNLSGDPG